MTDAATRAQTLAADPAASTWLSANAGSGKTRVLTDRVARLLLAGTPPQNILCLTYTKAAAGEMQNRLFARLGGWAMLPDAELRAALVAMGEVPPADLGGARTLFARAIETPGGLKIQTIHSLAAALLRQFPLEAGVPPAFTEIDDSAQRQLMAEVFEDLAESHPAIVARVAAQLEHELAARLGEIAGQRDRFAPPLDHDAALESYGAPPGTDMAAILAGIGWDTGLMGRVIAALRAGSVTDQKHAETLAALPGRLVHAAHLEALQGMFLTGAGAKEPFASKAGGWPTKATRAALTADAAAIDALIDRVAAARPLGLALVAAERTAALHAFAAVFLPAYAEAKARRGWLDFDDLIDKAVALLTEGEAAEWVLWRMDGAIDHILVDESQDTSPRQWRIVERLAEEFSAGAGARGGGVVRTLFVVGDRKQSIYSFQGADAEAYDRMRDTFADRFRGGAGMAERELLHSFRSAPAILQIVDEVFAGQPGAGIGGGPKHIAFHAGRPGRVDLWPVVPPPAAAETPHWSDPAGTVDEDHASATLAAQIAEAIAGMLADPACCITAHDGRRRVTAGDILILVQTRASAGALFHQVIRACTTRGLPIAGADVLNLTEELAVRDLLALLSFLALEEDDLSLAAALRSPLFGLDEAALYDLAQGRPGTLWQALRTSPAHPEALAILRDLRGQTDYLRPYELLERILIRHDGRRRLVARMGPEIEDALDQLLSAALGYERREVPSLTRFLAWLEGEEVVVKRRPDQSGGVIRVMTVHGAKGLEAPVVILPDTLRADRDGQGRIVPGEDGRAHWKATGGTAPPTLATLTDAARERDRLERDRLLYVAMTRAESWLIVCGAGRVPSGRCWYGDIEAGLLSAGATPKDDGLRFETGDWTAPAGPYPASATGLSAASAATLPPWAGAPAPAPPVEPVVHSPSDLGGAKALPGEAGLDEDEAKRAGTRVHLLLQHLPGVPATDRAGVAADLLATGDTAAPPEVAAQLAREVGALIDRPDLAHLFGPDALAEVDLTAALPDGVRVHGAVDRLILDPDRVLVVDFKTNATVPARAEDTPDGLLRQMGAYRAALAAIFPGRVVEVAILWTRTGTLMPLPSPLVDAALARADLTGGGAAALAAT